MAKRGRVPGRKSLHGGHRQRNKNPKLSPFQREQKRTRLANQPPIENGNKRDFPASQRGVYLYLQQREEREAAKKQAKRDREAAAAAVTTPQQLVSDAVEPKETDRKKRRRTESASAAADAADPSKAPRVGKLAKKKLERNTTDPTASSSSSKHSDVMSAVSSLNDELKSGMTPLEQRTDLTALHRKERKHQKRVEKRKERIMERMQKMEADLEHAMSKAGKKKKKAKAGSTEDAYEKKLIQMQKEKAKEDAVKAAALKKQAKQLSSGSGNEEQGSSVADAPSAGGKKRIVFDEATVGSTAAQHRVATRKPQDFYEYVDIVRYGERVEAPPVFDNLPSASTAVGKLALKLAAAEDAAGARKRGNSVPNRHAILSGSASGVSDPTSLAERKRLASLGLGARPTELVAATSKAPKSHDAKLREMELLRQKVVESYQRSKVKRYGGAGAAAGGAARLTKNVGDMKHVFPMI